MIFFMAAAAFCTDDRKGFCFFPHLTKRGGLRWELGCSQETILAAEMASLVRLTIVKSREARQAHPLPLLRSGAMGNEKGFLCDAHLGMSESCCNVSFPGKVLWGENPVSFF